MKSTIGVSHGSAVELGLTRGTFAEKPTTAYLFLKDRKCSGSCAFCPQSTEAGQRISRVDWPEFFMDDLLKALSSNKALKRVCVQCSNEESVRNSLPHVIRAIRESTEVPISISSSPMTQGLMHEVKGAGADCLTIPLDCASEGLFRAVKGSEWGDCWKALELALPVFGVGNVGSHLIVGLGEEEKEVVVLMQRLWGMGIVPYLFAFTPVKGTPMEKREAPPLVAYRRLQLARHIIIERGGRLDAFEFDGMGRIKRFLIAKIEFESMISDAGVFMTSGCPGCNRPYFNERVSGPIFNFPRKPKAEEISRIRGEMLGAVEGY
ncbi:MAG: radical SAM protein [Candidatus Methanomethylicaceae archaeon]|jgi:biotin synthase